MEVKLTRPGLSDVFDFFSLSVTQSDLRPKNYKRRSLTEVADVPVSQTPSPRDSSVNEYAVLLCDACRSNPGKHHGPKICQQFVRHLQCNLPNWPRYLRINLVLCKKPPSPEGERHLKGRLAESTEWTSLGLLCTGLVARSCLPVRSADE